MIIRLLLITLFIYLSHGMLAGSRQKSRFSAVFVLTHNFLYKGAITTSTFLFAGDATQFLLTTDGETPTQVAVCLETCSEATAKLCTPVLREGATDTFVCAVSTSFAATAGAKIFATEDTTTYTSEVEIGSVSSESSF
jgi:hypothetical protein